MAQLIFLHGELLETGVHQCFQCLCAHLSLGEDELVADERLGFLGILGWHLGEVTEVWSHALNLKHLCLVHHLWVLRVDRSGTLQHLHRAREP